MQWLDPVRRSEKLAIRSLYVLCVYDHNDRARKLLTL